MRCIAEWTNSLSTKVWIPEVMSSNPRQSQICTRDSISRWDIKTGYEHLAASQTPTPLKHQRWTTSEVYSQENNILLLIVSLSTQLYISTCIAEWKNSLSAAFYEGICVGGNRRGIHGMSPG
jgi:hypothetical protein